MSEPAGRSSGTFILEPSAHLADQRIVVGLRAQHQPDGAFHRWLARFTDGATQIWLWPQRSVTYRAGRDLYDDWRSIGDDLRSAMRKAEGTLSENDLRRLAEARETPGGDQLLLWEQARNGN